jgi:hypothetical protein
VSRYLLLVILNTPFIIAGALNSLVRYKMGQLSLLRFVSQISFWIVIFTGLILAKPIYEFLFSNNLTQSEPLSLFDVIQITGIVFLLFVTSRTRSKVESLERRIQDLHQELSIKLSKK